MQFQIQRTYGSEVRMAGFRTQPALKHYGAPKESGYWWIDLNAFEDYVAGHLKPMMFGASVQKFRFGFEMTEGVAQDGFFTPLANYVSYRPKSKELISVGQLDYADLKNRRPKAQLAMLAKALKQAAARVAEIERKPKNFDFNSFARAIGEIADSCPLDLVAWKHVA